MPIRVNSPEAKQCFLSNLRDKLHRQPGKQAALGYLDVGVPLALLLHFTFFELRREHTDDLGGQVGNVYSVALGRVTRCRTCSRSLARRAAIGVRSVRAASVPPGHFEDDSDRCVGCADYSDRPPRQAEEIPANADRCDGDEPCPVPFGHIELQFLLEVEMNLFDPSSRV